MPVQVELVTGADWSQQASRVLREAWAPPSIDYSESYLAWQFAFPGGLDAPAALAREADEVVAFAGATSRRLRCAERYVDAVIVSFVAVRPAWRGSGLGGRLYAALLGKLQQLGIPVITFALQGSAGERLLLKEYPRAGFRVRRLEDYAGYTASVRGGDDAQVWQGAEPSGAQAALEAMAEQCSADPTLAWNAPTAAQLRHYFEDERRRTFLFAGAGTSPLASAFVVESAYRSARGLERILITDTLWLDRDKAERIAGLVSAAVRELGATSAANHAVVSFPSLSGFAAEPLRAVGIRRTGPTYSSYVCYSGEHDPFNGVRALSLELV